MLTPSDYNNLKLLYEQFLKANLQIKELINQQNLDDLDIAVQEKENLLRKIIFFEKPRIKDIKENNELNKIRLKLIELEKENIATLNSVKESLIKEYSDIQKNKKVINAYEPSLNQTSSTIDIKDEA